MGMNISANTYSNMHPRISLDANGNPLVIWGRMNDQSCFFSKWNGTMFTMPVKLNGTLTVATASWMGPDIASHGDTVTWCSKKHPKPTPQAIFLLYILTMVEQLFLRHKG